MSRDNDRPAAKRRVYVITALAGITLSGTSCKNPFVNNESEPTAGPTGSMVNGNLPPGAAPPRRTYSYPPTPPTPPTPPPFMPSPNPPAVPPHLVRPPPTVMPTPNLPVPRPPGTPVVPPPTGSGS